MTGSPFLAVPDLRVCFTARTTVVPLEIVVGIGIFAWRAAMRVGSRDCAANELAEPDSKAIGRLASANFQAGLRLVELFIGETPVFWLPRFGEPM
jgi:hypothetical protein